MSGLNFVMKQGRTIRQGVVVTGLETILVERLSDSSQYLRLRQEASSMCGCGWVQLALR
jgi:hypothetical protein